MRRRTLAWLAALVVLLEASPSAACDPVDALAYVAPAGDGFLFARWNEAMLVSARGEVRHRRPLDEPVAVALLDDDRTLLVVDGAGPTYECLPSTFRFSLLARPSSAPARSIGRVRVRDGAAQLAGLPPLPGGRLEVAVGTWGGGDESVQVAVIDASTTRARFTRRPRTPEASVPAASVAANDEMTELRVLDAGGTSRVTVALSTWSPSYALSRDASVLAVVTYSRESDYGTGFDARLDLVDKATGARSTVGDGTGVARVRGRASASCATRVNDPASDLNVRAAPSARAAVVGTLAHGTEVSVGAETQGSWRRVTAPLEGWAHAERLAFACDLAPPRARQPVTP